MLIKTNLTIIWDNSELWPTRKQMIQSVFADVAKSQGAEPRMIDFDVMGEDESAFKKATIMFTKSSPVPTMPVAPEPPKKNSIKEQKRNVNMRIPKNNV